MKKILLIGLLAVIGFILLFPSQTTAEKTSKVMLSKNPVEIECKFIHNKTTIHVKAHDKIQNISLSLGEKEFSLEEVLPGWSFIYTMDGQFQTGKIKYVYGGSAEEKPFYCS